MARPDVRRGARLRARVWTVWNHVRAAASLGAAALITIGLIASRGGTN